MNRLSAFLLILFMAGCAKNPETDLKPNLNTANDIILTQRPFVFAFNLLVKASLDSVLQATWHANIDGAAIVLNPGKKKYTFTFSGKMSPDSVYRFGNFQAILDTGLFIQGSKTTIIFNYYSEDGHLVTAKDSLICEGVLPGAGLVFRNLLSEVTVTKDSARKIKWEGNFVFTAPENLVSAGTKKAVVMIEGTGQGISSMGYLFSSVISSSLRDSLSCPWPKQGIIDFSIPEAEVQSGRIEFMAGNSCNNVIYYDFNGVIYHWWICNKYLIK